MSAHQRSSDHPLCVWINKELGLFGSHNMKASVNLELIHNFYKGLSSEFHDHTP